MAGELELAKGLKTTTNVPADAWRGPYTSVADAMAKVPEAMRSYRTVDIIEDEEAVEYLWGADATVNPTKKKPTLSGDVTTTETGEAVIGANKVTNAKLAQMPTKTIKGNQTGGSADPQDLTVAELKTMLQLSETTSPTQPLGSRWGNKPKVSLSKIGETHYRVVATAGTSYWDDIQVDHAIINGIDDDIPIPSVNKFFVYVYYFQSGGAELRIGAESETSPQAPDAPVNGLLNTYFLITPKGAISDGGVSSTDDVVEGSVNKYFTDVRAWAAETTATLWSYLGLATSATKISVKNWLENLTGKMNTFNTLVTTGRLSKYQETTPGIPDFNGTRLIRLGEAAAITAEDAVDLVTGAVNLFTAQKQPSGEIKYVAGIGQIDKLASPLLASSITDDKAWTGHQIILTGDNTDGDLGTNSQELYSGRRGYIVIDSTPENSKIFRFPIVAVLDSSISYDQSIITQLETEAGWVQNLKKSTVKSVKGDWYGNTTGYMYFCINELNDWIRIGQPKVKTMQITNTGDYATLCTNLNNHDFSTGVYDAAVIAAPNEKGSEGQEYYNEATRKLYRCVKNRSGQILWELF